MGVVGLRTQPFALQRAFWGAFNGAQLVFTALLTATGICVALLARVVTGDCRWPLWMAARCWAPALLRGAGARLQVEGLERVDWSRPQVFVANHESVIDVCALFRAMPVSLRFVLKQELARVPFVGWYARAMGMVFVERGNARSARRHLREAVELLGNGASLCAFPEGTRSRHGNVGAFKGGAFQTAIDAGVPVVPVAISGSGDVLPAGGFRVRPGTIVVRFGEPLPTHGLGNSDRHALASRAHDVVTALLHGHRAA